MSARASNLGVHVPGYGQAGMEVGACVPVHEPPGRIELVLTVGSFGAQRRIEFAEVELKGTVRSRRADRRRRLA